MLDEKLGSDIMRIIVFALLYFNNYICIIEF